MQELLYKFLELLISLSSRNSFVNRDNYVQLRKFLGINLLLDQKLLNTNAVSSFHFYKINPFRLIAKINELCRV